MSPRDSGFGGDSQYPAFPGSRPKNDMQHDLSHQMEGMDISGGQRPPPGRNGMGPPRGPMPPPPGDGYGGRPPMDGPGRGPRPYPPQDYPDQRRGPPPGQGYGPSNGYPEENFGPPARSMTMPAREPQMDMRGARPPPRGDSIPYNTPRPGAGRGMGMPPRPSTAQGGRPPPQDMYAPNNGGPYQEPGYDNGPAPDAGYRGQQQRPASYDDFYDYYDGRGSGDYGPSQHRGSGQSGMAGFDAGPQQRPAEHLDQQVQSPPAPGQPQRGAARLPEVSRTKSQPDLRQPQAAVFEMAGDMPPIPTQYQQRSGGPQQGQGYEQPGPYQDGQFGRRRSYDQAGPAPGPGLPNNPAPYRPGAQPSSASVHSASSADTLPSHPMPVRAGLMPNSVVNLNSKPPPVRNYNGVNGVAPPASVPQQAQPQAQLPQQPPSGAQAAPSKPKEPPVTVEDLDRLKAKIKTSPADQESALTLAKKLCEAADVLVPQLPDPKSRARSRERYLLDAQKILKKLSSNGNMHAMFFMADCLGRGLFGAEPDNKEAFLLYQSAAKQGHAAAAYRTAVCCEIGNEEGGGTRKDPLKAIQWYKRAAMLGDTPAMYKVGMILLKGLLGQPRNPREAVGWLKRAAERADADNPHALHELGLLYESAEGNDALVRDEAYAFRLFKQAADLGYKFSQYRMGAAYEYGLMGVPVDARLSIMWYSRAATQEEHQSELALSGWYLTGSEGVLQQSDTEAYLWARKAAMAGLAKAEYAMGYFTEVGIGVPANLEDAKRWYWRAAAQDFPKARERLEDLKRSGKNGPRQRERISRSRIEKQQEGECVVM
ncbi:HCP-like protein [Coniochaeta sp. PMI_546]|nr:HCP-like protein [Coniochaeta sp. PMI_546]